MHIEMQSIWSENPLLRTEKFKPQHSVMINSVVPGAHMM